ncbi:Transmembrane amino acid transporter protein [Trichomonas vaginalis G3]|uniref:Transmembrane amino acid transporter protein n=1 Tax=Trichomonas vaginalis (strain ATCC PRA-98 / G3) TaxID=412133 RepID=A2ET77_TRIV3|nr:amino acid transmembrane transporter protein [Trichomonas vaginalis G3]EAY04130.1 Transmembrane amino acid transporter protein [Trichomonas vaginalis G3]KAI5549863.1 amino acid transmembrane transporter protein [Trichomonas vaginalis G3]|eukprot:XP_001316353.1 Transmembrane amino acid transporter protein [Trichomonas vaginalis G3]
MSDSKILESSLLSEVSEQVKPDDYMKFFPAFMNILNTLTGAEVLSVSNSMTLIGLIYSIGLMVITTILSYLGTILVLYLRNQVDAESINELATKIIGKWGGNVYSALTLCFTYSCQTAYLYIGADSVIGWTKLAGLKNWDHGLKRSLQVFIYAMVLPVLLTIPREMKILSIVSTGAILCQVIYVSGMMYEGIKILPSQGIDPTCESHIFGIVFFNAFAIYSMLYAFPSVVLPLVRNYNPDMRKRYVLIGASFVACFSITIIPGTIGYLLFGRRTNQIVYASFDHSDIFMQIVRVGFFIVVNASYAVVSITVMQDLSSIFCHVEDPADLPFKKRVIALLVANLPPVAFAMFLPEIRPAFEVGGAFGGCLSNFFVPPLLYVILSKKRWFSPMNLLMIAFSLFGLVSAVIATYQAVVDALNPED